MDDELKAKFEDITRTILSNQTEALANLTLKVEKEIGQVWRQMGIVYGQVSNSISILEKVKTQTEGYVNNTGRNLGEMEGTVEGLSERMVDVDSNLNYMLGQLSLVVQEFNQIRIWIFTQKKNLLFFFKNTTLIFFRFSNFLTIFFLIREITFLAIFFFEFSRRKFLLFFSIIQFF